MTRLVFVDVDDTLLTPPYEAVRKVATFFGKKFPPPEAFVNRSAVDYFSAFPGLFKNPAEMWAIALLSLPFGHFRSQKAMAFDVQRMSELLTDRRLYLLSKNPPSFTRWRVQRLQQIFSARLGDRYIACGPILRKGQTKLSIMQAVAADRKVQLADCLLVDDSVENLCDAAGAGLACALVRSSWNEAQIEALKAEHPRLQVVESTGIPDVIAGHLAGPVNADRVAHFVVPPLTPRNVLRLGRTFAERWWLYSEPLPRLKQIIPVARSPYTSLLYRDPHANIRARLRDVLAEPAGLAGTRLLHLRRGDRPTLLPLTLRAQLQEVEGEEAVRMLRTVCRDLFATRGHRFVREPMFYFTELNRDVERQRILRSQRVTQAKVDFAQTHNATAEEADKLARQYVEELMTSRTYVSCLAGEWILDRLLARIFKRINLKSHPAVRELEHDHFLFFASTHRSYLDSPVLWSILSHNGQSFPFAVGADKMRTVWFGRLGIRGGTFFLRRKFIDVIYASIIAEHVSSMQQPGSVIEVFLEGQRSRSGLTLPPKKGIASIVWENMGPKSKVAIVPVSFVYNKIPESEKLIQERFDERRKLGVVSLREVADMKIRATRKKTTYDQIRAAWRRIRSPKVSECFVQFAEPIVLNKNAEGESLQGQLNEAMQRINSATAILPSSILCLCLLNAEDGHATFAAAAEFLRFAKGMVGLYHLPPHLPLDLLSASPEKDVQAFAELPFVNRKFKRAKMREREILCIDELDIERASYYKNNVLHFFVLPAILSYVLTDVHSGRTEELHRCFDVMFAKLQATYFLPKVGSTAKFIDAFLHMLAERNLIAVSGNQWVVNDQKTDAALLRILARLGGELVQDDLPNLLDAIRRSSNRTDVHVASRLAAVETITDAQAKALGLSATEFYVQCDASAKVGDKLAFRPAGANVPVSGTVVRVDVDGVAVRQDEASRAAEPDAPPATLVASGAIGGQAEGEAAAAATFDQVVEGSVLVKREQQAMGVITNLSPSGAFVATDLRLKIGSRVTCSLGGEQDAFEVSGRVTRVTETGVGVFFDGLSEEGKARVVLLSVGAQRANQSPSA